MKWRLLAVFSVLNLLGAPVAQAQGVAPGAVPEVTTTPLGTVQPAPASSGGPPSLFDDGKPQQIKSATITAHIKVFRNVTPVDSFGLSPFPARPPKVPDEKKPSYLPSTEKDVQQLLRSSAYQNVSSWDKPYPMGGWRWQFALRRAITKSGMTPPHSIFTEYQWARDIAPYVVRETKMFNAMDQERQHRYDKAVEEFEKTREDCEEQATRAGLSPVEMRKVSRGVATGSALPGNWWLTCTRKCPGLTYWWQIPITVTSGQNVDLTLNEDNATVIMGAW